MDEEMLQPVVAEYEPQNLHLSTQETDASAQSLLLSEKTEPEENNHVIYLNDQTMSSSLIEHEVFHDADQTMDDVIEDSASIDPAIDLGKVPHSAQETSSAEDVMQLESPVNEEVLSRDSELKAIVSPNDDDETFELPVPLSTVKPNQAHVGDCLKVKECSLSTEIDEDFHHDSVGSFDASFKAAPIVMEMALDEREYGASQPSDESVNSTSATLDIASLSLILDTNVLSNEGLDVTEDVDLTNPDSIGVMSLSAEVPFDFDKNRIVSALDTVLTSVDGATDPTEEATISVDAKDKLKVTIASEERALGLPADAPESACTRSDLNQKLESVYDSSGSFGDSPLQVSGDVEQNDFPLTTDEIVNLTNTSVLSFPANSAEETPLIEDYVDLVDTGDTDASLRKSFEGKASPPVIESTLMDVEYKIHFDDVSTDDLTGSSIQTKPLFEESFVMNVGEGAGNSFESLNDSAAAAPNAPVSVQTIAEENTESSISGGTGTLFGVSSTTEASSSMVGFASMTAEDKELANEITNNVHGAFETPSETKANPISPFSVKASTTVNDVPTSPQDADSSFDLPSEASPPVIESTLMDIENKIHLEDVPTDDLTGSSIQTKPLFEESFVMKGAGSSFELLKDSAAAPNAPVSVQKTTEENIKSSISGDTGTLFGVSMAAEDKGRTNDNANDVYGAVETPNEIAAIPVVSTSPKYSDSSIDLPAEAEASLSMIGSAPMAAEKNVVFDVSTGDVHSSFASSDDVATVPILPVSAEAITAANVQAFSQEHTDALYDVNTESGLSSLVIRSASITGEEKVPLDGASDALTSASTQTRSLNESLKENVTEDIHGSFEVPNESVEALIAPAIVEKVQSSLKNTESLDESVIGNQKSIHVEGDAVSNNLVSVTNSEDLKNVVIRTETFDETENPFSGEQSISTEAAIDDSISNLPPYLLHLGCQSTSTSLIQSTSTSLMKPVGNNEMSVNQDDRSEFITEIVAEEHANAEASLNDMVDPMLSNDVFTLNSNVEDSMEKHAVLDAFNSVTMEDPCIISTAIKPSPSGSLSATERADSGLKTEASTSSANESFHTDPGKIPPVAHLPAHGKYALLTADTEAPEDELANERKGVNGDPPFVSIPSENLHELFVLTPSSCETDTKDAPQVETTLTPVSKITENSGKVDSPLSSTAAAPCDPVSFTCGNCTVS